MGRQKNHAIDDKLHCGICGKVFTASRSRILHERTHYTCYECYLCGKTFSRKTTLNKHLKKPHVKPQRCSFVCKKCGKRFKHETYRKIHEKAHYRSYECRYCFKSFTRKTLSISIYKNNTLIKQIK